MDVSDSLLAYNIPMSTGLFKISLSDIGRGLAVAVLGPLFVAVCAALGSIILAPNFDVFAVNWAALGHSLVNISIVASYGGFSGYISKQLITSSQGNILGVGDIK